MLTSLEVAFNKFESALDKKFGEMDMHGENSLLLSPSHQPGTTPPPIAALCYTPRASLHPMRAKNPPLTIIWSLKQMESIPLLTAF